MANRNKAKARQNPYVGLQAEFRRLSTYLCLTAMPPEAWKEWHNVSFLSHNKKVRFPKNGRNEDILSFVDEFLFQELLPRDISPPNRRMLPRWRGDLNKYRGWLLHRLLLQMVEQEKDKQSKKRRNYKYRLPEDLPKIIDDLRLFHIHVQGIKANIVRYESLNALGKITKPYQLKYPIPNNERAIAHARHLETKIPRELNRLLPLGWKADLEFVRIDRSTKIPRVGGAELIALLENGTEVIQVKEEAASLAYGSPRWCTAYMNGKNYFSNYKDDLIIVINPNGSRWQLHFRTRQFTDAADNQIDIIKLIENNPGLDQKLYPYWQKTFGKVPRGAEDYYSRTLEFCPCLELFLSFLCEQKEYDRGLDLLSHPRFRLGVNKDFADNFIDIILWSVKSLRSDGYEGIKTAAKVTKILEEYPPIIELIAARIHTRFTKDKDLSMIDVAVFRPEWAKVLNSKIRHTFSEYEKDNQSVFLFLEVAARNSEWASIVVPDVRRMFRESVAKGDWGSVSQLLDVVALNEDWSRGIKPYIREALKLSLKVPPAYDYDIAPKILNIAVENAEWHPSISGRLIRQSLLYCTTPEPFIDVLLFNDYGVIKILECSERVPLWRESITPIISKIADAYIDNYRYITFVDLLNTIGRAPVWNKALAKELPNLLNHAIEKCPPAITPLLDWASKEPYRVGKLTPYIAQAYEKAYQAGDHAHAAFSRIESTTDWDQLIKPRRPRHIDALLGWYDAGMPEDHPAFPMPPRARTSWGLD